MRIAGAQIPVTEDVKTNFEAIMKAIEWAVENKVDYLFTPEASLSGYNAPAFTVNTCGETEDAMEKLVQYASSHKLGLIIGTLWLDDKDKIDGAYFGFKSNQLRFYNQEGEYIGSTKKTRIISYDADCVTETNPPVVTLTKGEETLKIGALICNDLVGNYYWGGENLAKKLQDEQVALIIHASNTEKDQDPYIKSVHDNFHVACTQFISFAIKKPILSVDNPWHIHGAESNTGTSFTSGIYLPSEFKHKAPNIGTQYFYYDHNNITHSFMEGTNK